MNKTLLTPCCKNLVGEKLLYLSKNSMKNLLVLIFSIFLIQKQASAQTYSTRDIQKMAWIAGSWKMNGKKGPIYENWYLKNDSTYQSKSFRVRTSGDTLLLETVELGLREGELLYIPTVNGQNDNEPVSFRITRLDHNGFQGTNKGHDFPQHINYRLQTKNNLIAVVSGIISGKEEKQVFNYTRQ